MAARFHPRVGEIVVIDFFEGDVDRPFVVGRIHEAERHQTMFDVKGTLPATKKTERDSFTRGCRARL